MLEHILIIAGKAGWFLFECVFAGLSFPFFFIAAVIDGSVGEFFAQNPSGFLTKVLPFWLFVLLYIAWTKPKGLTGFIARIHYFFVPHPAEAPIKDAVRTQKPIDTNQLAEIMERTLDVNPDDLPARYKSKNQTEKAKDLATLVEADRKLMEAVAERERALRAVQRQAREK